MNMLDMLDNLDRLEVRQFRLVVYWISYSVKQYAGHRDKDYLKLFDVLHEALHEYNYNHAAFGLRSAINPHPAHTSE